MHSANPRSKKLKLGQNGEFDEKIISILFRVKTSDKDMRYNFNIDNNVLYSITSRDFSNLMIFKLKFTFISH